MILLVSSETTCIETHDTFVSCETVHVETNDTFVSCKTVHVETNDTFSIVPVDIYHTLGPSIPREKSVCHYGNIILLLESVHPFHTTVVRI